jgi:NAD(P)-dependent dehydrogenase (short-subunit alcohol dehydrogenase family)
MGLRLVGKRALVTASTAGIRIAVAANLAEEGAPVVNGLPRSGWRRSSSRRIVPPLLQQFIEPEEVAAMVAFVCSPVSSSTNGASLRADGGVVRTVV